MVTMIGGEYHDGILPQVVLSESIKEHPKLSINVGYAGMVGLGVFPAQAVVFATHLKAKGLEAFHHGQCRHVFPVIGGTQRGSVIQFVLADSAALHKETQSLRLVDDADFRLSASHSGQNLPLLLDGDVNTEWTTAQQQDGTEWLTLVFDNTIDVARIRMDLHRQSFGDYPRILRIESSSNRGRNVLYEGSGLVPLVRGVLQDNFLRSAIELDFKTNDTKTLKIQQTGQAVDTPWSVYELRVWKR